MICLCIDGKIGEDVKYRANAFLDSVYVCLDPREGRVFVSGLTYRTSEGIESSLQGPGMYVCSYVCNALWYRTHNMYHFSRCSQSSCTQYIERQHAQKIT